MLHERRRMTEKGDIRIVILSDTHGDRRVIERVIAQEEPFDYLIHCGDAEIDLSEYADPAKPYELLAVRGNCDYYSDLPAAINTQLGGLNVLITHGHHENVHSGVQALAEAGRSLEADLIFSGHTHIPEIAEEGGILIINPGSPVYPRGLRRQRTYAVLTVSGKQERNAVIKTVKD